MASDTRPVKQPGKGKNPVPKDGYLPVNEMLGEYQGANSPFGDEVKFPLPIESLPYTHPEHSEPSH